MNLTPLVIVPTYNEAENIEELLQAISELSTNFDVLVVDDSSPDGTSDIVTEYQKQNSYVFLEKRNIKNGLGKAYIHGFKWALKKDYQYILQMDADFSHSPKDLERLLESCAENKNDVAIGSRYIEGINVVHWPLSRILLSYAASWYVRIITGMKIYDPTAGFVCYKRKVLEAINFDDISFIGYAFQIEMKYICFIKKMKIKELSIIFKNRIKGNSKMNVNIIAEAVCGVLKLRFKRYN